MICRKNISFFLAFIIYFSYIFIPKKVKAIPQIPLAQEHKIDSETLSVIDYWKQHFFELLRPEVIGKDVKIYDTLYRREKAAISQVVTYVLFTTCHQPHRNHYFFLTEQARPNHSKKYPRYRYNYRRINRNLSNRQSKLEFSQNNQQKFVLEDEHLWERDFYWRQNRDYFFEGLYRDLTDAIFYARHPEISLQEDKIQHLNWATEWDFIRRRFANYDQEQVLKQYFIPVCHDFQ